jgi:MinD-like ATPase involved in chromosome partitioning or flagellar assembly
MPQPDPPPPSPAVDHQATVPVGGRLQPDPETGPAFGWSGEPEAENPTAGQPPPPEPPPASEPPPDPQPGPTPDPPPGAPPEPTPGPPPDRPAPGELRTDQLLARPPGGPALGWQGMVYRLTGGRMRPGPGPVERAQHAMAGRIGTPIAGCRRIAVVALKGGVGKTTTTACLGAIFAEHRGDRVVAVDANPDPGTLGYRIRRDTLRTSKDLLADVDKLERYADIRAYASQTDLGFEVIVSEVDPDRTEMFGEDDYRELAALLERFYSLVLTDCGPGLLHSAMKAILPAADQLVVVSVPSLDGARSASLTLDWLERHGYERLARSSVVVINAVRERGLVDVDKLQDHFARRCRAVVRVPFDRHLETGAEIVLDELAPSTRRAYVALAAAVADGFGEPPPEGSPG